ncbi:MAG TPA: hypothetical protein VJ044_09030, partial [Candidatus Hodarchaeales archaeon]|nr:hypothetical protein [Candidatus Hodarchaeales archaeon]
VSQNLGHENIGTTLTTYGTLDQFRVADVIKGIDFSAAGRANKHELIEMVKKQLDRLDGAV